MIHISPLTNQDSSAAIGIAPDMPPNAPIPWTAELGKAAVPQRHAQLHAPPTLVPVPVAMVTVDPLLLSSDPLEPEETSVAADTEAVDKVVAAVLGVPPTMAAAVPVPFCAMAICSNMAWVLLAVGLMEKVMPFPQ